MEKIIRLGDIQKPGMRFPVSVFCKITIKDGKLSITGVEGPTPNGDCKGSCGQIEINPTMFASFAPGWSKELSAKFSEVWKRWHLNDMRAGCEHQRKEGWDKKPIDPSKPLRAYGKHFDGQRSDSWNMLTWVRPDEHPEGLLTKPCSICGYRYGTAWFKEELPEEVVEFLHSLPDSDKTPAWV